MHEHVLVEIFMANYWDTQQNKMMYDYKNMFAIHLGTQYLLQYSVNNRKTHSTPETSFERMRASSKQQKDHCSDFFFKLHPEGFVIECNDQH